MSHWRVCFINTVATERRLTLLLISDFISHVQIHIAVLLRAKFGLCHSNKIHAGEEEIMKKSFKMWIESF